MEQSVKRPKLSCPRGVCVKVSSLRPRYKSLKDWKEASTTHVLVTRRGRIFLDKTTVYAYPSSPWANPFVVGKGKFSLEESLREFEKHLNKLLNDNDQLKAFVEMMSNATEIGCFCESGKKCHRDILIQKWKTINNFVG